MEYSEIKKEAQEMMRSAVDHTWHEFSNIHTGKATPSLVEGIQVHVESYGTSMPVRELAAITCPDNHTIQIQPWDKNVSGAIDKAIRGSNMGLNPVSKGAVIIVPIPELSMDRRKDLVRIASNHAETGRVSVRQARHHAMDELKKLKAEGHVGEDDIKRYEKEIQELTDQHTGEINSALEEKEKELTSV